MIKIEERTTEKVPGETSFFISFDYKPQYIDIVKQFSGTNYNKNTKEWEIPIVYLSKLLDDFSIYDNIELKLLEEKQEENIDYSQIELDNYKLKPFPYQERGIKYGLNHDKWLLLDEMGLGKTPQIICLANELRRQGKINHCLIICGVNSLKNNWRKEIQKFTNLSCTILGERTRKNGNKYMVSIKERAEQLKNPIDEFFIITNIETFRSKEVVKAFQKSKNDIGMIAVDEVHKIKDPGTQQSKGLLELKSEYMVGATGTLIMNSPLDTYVPLKWLGIEKSTFTNFKYFYCDFGGPFHNILCGFKNTDMLHNIIKHHSLRRTKKEELPDLPPKTIVNEYVDMEDDQSIFYEKIKKGIKDQVDKIDLNTTNLLALVTRLRQATACPQILTSENISSVKIDRAIDIAEQILSNNEKVVIFSTFKETVYQLEERLKNYNPLIGTGDIKDDIVFDRMEEFQNDPNKKLFIGTWSKCGTGFTLNASSYLIFIDTPFTYAAYSQAQDRIYRLGTDNPVFIYNIICNNTIDERVLEIIEDKSAISDYLIDGEITEQSLNRLRKYITEEL